MTARSAADAAAASVLEQVIAAVEASKQARDLTAADLSTASGLSPRQLVNLRKLQVRRPTLSALLALTRAAGIRLEIRIRPLEESRDAQ